MSNRSKAMMSLILTITSLLSLVAASYAWVTMSAAPIASDFTIFLVSDNDDALMLAHDENGVPGEYKLVIDMSEKINVENELVPVSFSALRYGFLIPEYSWDGRIKSSYPVSLTPENPTDDGSSYLFSPAADSEELGNYLVKSTFWIRSKTFSCTLSLSSLLSGKENQVRNGSYLIGQPTWSDTAGKHVDEGKGAQYAVRIGLFFYGTERDPYDTKFIIYEPNADGGKAVTVGGEFFTESADNPGKNLAASDSRCKLIQQSTSTWSELDPPLADSVSVTPGVFLSEDRVIMRLEANEERKCTLFVWLEGQDPDCENRIESGKIIANLQFSASNKEMDSPIYPE